MLNDLAGLTTSRASNSGGSGNSLRLPEYLAGGAFGQFVDADDLDGEIVLAAGFICHLDDGLCGLVEIIGAVLDRASDLAIAGMLIDAVGDEHKSVALLDPEHHVVDLDLGIYPERTAEIALLRRDDDAVVVGQLLERVAGDAIDPAVADVKQMRRGRFDDDGAQRADIAAVLVVGILAARVCECSQELVASSTRCAEVRTDQDSEVQ